MSLPIPGVLYQREHPDQAWHAKGRPSLNLPQFEIGKTMPTLATVGLRTPTTDVHNGDLTLTTAQTIVGLRIVGRLNIPQSATGQIILKNCVIDASGVTVTKNGNVVTLHVNTGAHLTLEDCEIIGTTGLMGVGPRHFTLVRSYVHHCEDAVRLHNANGTSNPDLDAFVIANVLGPLIVRVPDPFASRSDLRTHSDVIQIEGGSNAVIRGNMLNGYATTDGTSNIEWALEAFPYQSVKAGTANARPHPQALSGIMMTPTSTATPIKNLLIEDNWMPGGEFGINGGASENEFTTGTIRRNRFPRDQWHQTNAAINLDAKATGVLTFDDTPDANIWLDTGAPIKPRRNG